MAPRRLLTRETSPPRPATPVSPRERPPQPGVVRGEHHGAMVFEVQLVPGRVYTIGRHAPAELRFDDHAVSRMHGTLRHRDGHWVYTDAGSTNGTARYLPKDLSPDDDDAEPSGDVFTGSAISVAVGDVLGVGSARCRLRFLPASDRPVVAHRPDILASRAAREFDQMLARASSGDAPVFLLGASGTGKTHAASEIHRRSKRKGRFVEVNCASLPDDPTELTARFLGFVRGAYTGAIRDEEGLLFLADGGTLFLDEVESLPSVAQGFMLDVLEGRGEFLRLGARQKRAAPRFKLISASKTRVRHSRLREDLGFRLLRGDIIEVPGLDERREDIPAFLKLFADEACQHQGVRAEVSFAPAAEELAVRTAWPGELRELRSAVHNVVRWAVQEHGAVTRLTVGRELLQRHLESFAKALGGSVDDVERTQELEVSRFISTRKLGAEELRSVLSQTRGNKAQAARQLGIALNTLKRKMRQFGLE